MLKFGNKIIFNLLVMYSLEKLKKKIMNKELITYCLKLQQLKIRFS